MYIIGVLALTFDFAGIPPIDARVYCQDEHAAPWRPLGYACQITCGTILSAIDRLKTSDYDNLVKGSFKNKINISNNEIYDIGQQLQDNFERQSTSLQNNTKKHLRLFNTYHRLLSNENFARALEKEAGKMTALLTAECQNTKMAADEGYYKKFISEKCKRNFKRRSDILTNFKRFLNKYADPDYQFDRNMTGDILETDLTVRRSPDYDGILTYLSKVLRYHKIRTGTKLINLKGTSCLTTYLPGCYCRFGYVEHHGQCVRPAACIRNPQNAEYLERIILH